MIAFSSILVRLSGATPSTAAIFRCVYALPPLWLLAMREDRRLGDRSWSERRRAFLGGVFLGADLILWHRSIEDVGAGLATVLGNVQVMLLPLIAWIALRERIGARILGALPLALVGVVLISGALGGGAYGRAPIQGAAYGLGSGIAYVGFLLLLRQSGADQRRPAGSLFDATASGAATSVIAGVLIGDAHLIPAWPSSGWLMVLAFSSQVLGWLLIVTSLPRLPAALVSVLLLVQPVVSMGAANLILGESPTSLQYLGAALVLSALLAATARQVPRSAGVRGSG